MPSAPRVIVLSPSDNVAVALTDLPAGARVQAGGHEIHATELIAQGHKLSLRDIAAGEIVVKYGFPIGRATQPIGRGAHVHVHNIESVRLRGDR
jgi:altronate hydrolase